MNAKQAKARCLDLCREIVRKRDGELCQRCGNWCYRGVEWAHVIPRSGDGRLSADPVNSLMLCMFCHDAWHRGERGMGLDWFREQFPYRWAEIQAKQLAHRGIGPIRVGEWMEIEKGLKEMAGE